MVKEIPIYIEGGGDSNNTKALLRKGFSSFFQDLVQIARRQRVQWKIIVCGSRNNAYRYFTNALTDHPNADIASLNDSCN
jgi:hypothetical protein